MIAPPGSRPKILQKMKLPMPTRPPIGPKPIFSFRTTGLWHFVHFRIPIWLSQPQREQICLASLGNAAPHFAHFSTGSILFLPAKVDAMSRRLENGSGEAAAQRALNFRYKYTAPPAKAAAVTR